MLQPGHLKAMFIGSNVTVPITDGKLNTGTWQGLWLCEHRNHGGMKMLDLALSIMSIYYLTFRLL